MTRRLPDGQLKAIVKMLADFYSFREIQRAVKVSLGMLSKIKHTAEKSSKSLEEISEMPPQDIALMIYGAALNKKAQPDWQTIHELRTTQRYTRKKCYELYLQENEGKDLYSYERFCAKYKEWKEKPSVKTFSK